MSERTCLVTGAAGFIGSHLCEALLAAGHTVVGVDAFTDNYPAAVKRLNLAACLDHPRFRFIEADVAGPEWVTDAGRVDWVFHLAARPGVRTSWGQHFSCYCEENILATQRLLESCLQLEPEKVVFASSSSVYGNARRLPVKESSPLHPISPYGATKVTGEHLCHIYHQNHRLPVCIVRFFTVYGPRQRPDMAFARWISAIYEGRPIIIFGDGHQKRDFTFVSDAAHATLLTAQHGKPGDAYNIAGGSEATPRDVLALLAKLTGIKPTIEWEEAQMGDARKTWADTSLARETLGFAPAVSLKDGVAAQIEEWRARSG